MKLIKSEKPALAMGLALTAIILTAPAFASDVSAVGTNLSQKVQQIKQSSKPKTNTTAKPSPNTRVVVNGKEQKLTDPIIMDNGRVFLPVRALGDILSISVDYKDKVATATNPTAHLELPLGYNKAVKDKSVILPIDTNNANTSIIAYNSRTYLPVRFISENLGYRIEYKSPIVSITTDGSAPTFPIVTPPTKPVDPPKPPTTSNKPPTYKGKTFGEESKDGKWWWDSDESRWWETDDQIGGGIIVGPIDPNGPKNGNWE